MNTKNPAVPRRHPKVERRESKARQTWVGTYEFTEEATSPAQDAAWRKFWDGQFAAATRD